MNLSGTEIYSYLVAIVVYGVRAEGDKQSVI